MKSAINDNPSHERPPTTAQERAKAFLRDALAYGPMPSSEVRERAETQGLAWRTVERASRALGVETSKIGKSWTWSLPGAYIPPRQAVEAALDLPALVQKLADRLDRIEAALAPTATPSPAPGRKLPDRRSNPGGRKPDGWNAGRWGPARLVRCGDCSRADQIDSAGLCSASGLAVTWPWARRSCAAFMALPNEGAQPCH